MKQENVTTHQTSDSPPEWEDWLLIECPLCNAPEIANDASILVCKNCGFTITLPDLALENESKHHNLIRKYFIAKKNLELTKTELVKYIDESLLMNEIDNLKRREFLEIHNEQERKEIWGRIFSVVFAITVFISLFYIFYLADLSIGWFIIVLVILLLFRGRFWKIIRDVFMRKKINEIKEKYQTEVSTLKKSFLSQKAYLSQVIEKYQEEINNIRTELAEQ